MTSDTPREVPRILGSFRSAGGRGVVRIENRYEARVDEVWSAITDPRRLAAWYGHVEGDLRPGGTFRLRVDASGWDGGGRVEVCEPPARLVVTSRESEEAYAEGSEESVPPFDEVIEASLRAAGDGTSVIIEVSGMPLDKIHFYAVGWQIHAEDLAGHLAGRERMDDEARWDALLPPYEELAALLRK